MAVLEQVWVEPEERGLLATLYPGVRVLKEPFPLFVPQQKLILVTEREVNFYQGKSLVVVTRRASVKLNNRKDLIQFVRSKGVSCSDSDAERLEFIEDEEFNQILKVALILERFPRSSVDSQSSTFKVFCDMFDSFDQAYASFRSSGQPHRVVFSALLTMMLKTQNLDAPGISPGYKKVLLKNKTYYGLYQRSVAQYLESPMSYADFLTFLASLSEPKRGGV